MALVTVACRLPHGLLLRLHKMEDRRVPLPGGGSITEPVAVQVGEQVKINGCAVPYGKSANFPIIGGFGLTYGVDKDFWDAWLAQNKDLDAVKNNMVFAHEKAENVGKKAEDLAKLRSGLDPLDPENLPRGFEKIETADEHKKKAA